MKIKNKQNKKKGLNISIDTRFWITRVHDIRIYTQEICV